MTFPVSGTYMLRLEVQDSLGASAFVERQVNVTSSSAPSITSFTTPSGGTGATFSYTITATNSPTSYGASGLPPGLSLSGATISGLPSQAGVYAATISASNGMGTGSATVTFTITSSVLTANISMPAAVVVPTSGSLSQNISFTGFSSLGNLTQYKYTILNPNGTALSSIGWTPFSATTTSVWVNSGYWNNQWVSSGYWGSVWVNTTWVPGPWDCVSATGINMDLFNTWPQRGYPSQTVYAPDGSACQVSDYLVGPFNFYQYPGHYDGHWDSEWVDTSGWVYQWVDTSGWNTQTTMQPVTNGSASTSVAITPATVLGTYKVTLDVQTATSQTYTVWQTYIAAAPPSSPTATAATSLFGTGFTANWGSVVGATGYRLDVSMNSGFTSFVAGYQDRDVGTATTFAVGGLASNTTYFYRMRAVGPGGTSGNSNVVQLTTLPIITTQPASQVAVATTTVTFSVVVSPGTAPLTYQWRKGTGNLVNGGNVSGATSASLVLTSVLAVDAGSYSVVVTNNATGSVTSNAATLTIGVIDLQVHRPQ